MTIKILGAILVITGCGGVGLKIAANYKIEENNLHNLKMILDFMISELRFRLTPLPQLSKKASQLFHNPVGSVFDKFSTELEKQQHTDPAKCMSVVLESCTAISPITKSQLITLGTTLGRFDLDGQIRGVEAVYRECERNLSHLRKNRENRLRSYQTLGICAGAALAILFV